MLGTGIGNFVYMHATITLTVAKMKQPTINPLSTIYEAIKCIS